LKVNLARTSPSDKFTGENDITNIGVSGTLAVTNGGTGATTATGARENLLIIVSSTEPQSISPGLLWFRTY
jgi:hypothetical protein